MTDVPSFLEEPSDTREAIMKATYRALCEYGYVDLTIQRIGEEFEKSKSLIYYHYEGKDELLLDFLDFMLEQYEERIPYPRNQRAPAYLAAILDRVLDLPGSAAVGDFSRAMVELRAQAAHDPKFREHFTRSDQFFRNQIARIIRMGIEDSDFQNVDPQRTASLIHAIIIGTMTGRASTNDEFAAQIRDEVDRYLEQCVLVKREAESPTG